MRTSLRGFTLIEIMVVVGVLALTLPMVLTILFSVLSQQVRIMRLTQVRNEGDTIASVIRNTIINNATRIESNSGEPVCKDVGSLTMNTMRFLDVDGNWFSFLFDNSNGGRLASHSASLPGGLPLHSDKIAIADYQIMCERTTVFQPPVITITFDVIYYSSSTRVEEQDIAMPYKIYIPLREYGSTFVSSP